MALAVLIVALVESAEEDDTVGRFRLLYSLGDEFCLAALVFQVLTCGDAIVSASHIAHIASDKVNLHAVFGQSCLQALQRGNLPLYLERGAASAHGHHLDGVLAHHEHMAHLLGVDGQHAVAVLQQHDAFLGYLSGCGVMSVGTEEAVRTMAVHRGAIEESQHATHLLVELTCGVFAFLYGLQIGTGEIIAVVGVGGAPAQSVGPGAELHVESVPHSLVGVVGSTPVAHHHSVEVPVVLQNLVQGVMVMAVVLVAIQVVCAHDGPCLALLNGSLESRQIDFVQGTVAHLHVHLMAIFLVVVQTIVLHACRHALRLQSLYVGHYHDRGEIRVFAHVLEVTSVEGSAVDVDAWSQDHVLATIESLLAQCLAVDTAHLRVPGGCKTGKGRESHTRVVGLSCLVPFVPQHVGAHTVWTIVSPEVRKSQSWNSSR